MKKVWSKVLLVCLLVLGGAATAVAVSFSLVGTRPSPTPQGPPSAETALPEELLALEEDPLEGERFGFLVCGLDNSQTLADVILYAQLDLTENTAHLLQIPRDLFIGEEYKTGKINEACLPFSSENPTQRIATLIETRLGLPVDGWAVVTLAGVRALVDSVGGVPIVLPREIDYLPGKTLPAGPVTLTGEQAEWLLRYRQGYENADLDRLEAQKLFLTAAFEKAKGLSRLQALRVAAQNYGYFKTDLPLSKAGSIIAAGMALTEDDITVDVVPTYGAQYKEYQVLGVSRYKFCELLNQRFFPDDPVEPWSLYLPVPPEQPESDAPADEPTPGEYLFDFSWDEDELANDSAGRPVFDQQENIEQDITD